MTQVKTGAEIVDEALELGEGLEHVEEMIDANTAIAVAEYKSDAKHVRQANENYRNENTLLMQELELCKVQCLMLSNALKLAWSKEYINGITAKEIAENALSDTKETIQAYRNEIVQKAKS